MTLYAFLQNKMVIKLYLLIFFILPPIFIRLNIIPRTPATNLITLFCSTLACTVIMVIEGIIEKERRSFSYFDLDTKDFRKKLRNYVCFTAIGIAFLLAANQILSLRYNTEIVQTERFLECWPILCLLQVLSYRVFLFKKLEILTKSHSNPERSLVILNTLFYAEMHIMFSWEFILICAIGGVFLALMYLRNRNSLLMLASHMILNFVAAWAGAFHLQH